MAYPRVSNTIKMLRGKYILDCPSPIAQIIATDDDNRIVYFRNGNKIAMPKERLKKIIDSRLQFEEKIREERARMVHQYGGGSSPPSRAIKPHLNRRTKTASISRFNLITSAEGFRDVRNYR